MEIPMSVPDIFYFQKQLLGFGLITEEQLRKLKKKYGYSDYDINDYYMDNFVDKIYCKERWDKFFKRYEN